MSKEAKKLPPLPTGYIKPSMSPVYSASMMMEYAEQAVREALAEQPAQQEPVAIPDVEFMRQVLSVAIAGLYEHYKDDVLRVFSLNDLQNVVDLSESLGSQQVEDIYRRAWDMLATPHPAQQQQELEKAKAAIYNAHADIRRIQQIIMRQS